MRALGWGAHPVGLLNLHKREFGHRRAHMKGRSRTGAQREYGTLRTDTEMGTRTCGSLLAIPRTPESSLEHILPQRLGKEPAQPHLDLRYPGLQNRQAVNHRGLEQPTLRSLVTAIPRTPYREHELLHESKVARNATRKCTFPRMLIRSIFVQRGEVSTEKARLLP